MTTGATLYLVSACGSAEEFVAAFRRYADRTGLFIPSLAPLPAGRRGRIALTLKDGGVMIEGEAEILQSSTKATVLHGRPGMTIKFVDADDLSKTVIGELEKARLAMKPAAPSVPPRPADVPAEPRPVVPAVGGRIDAANALAECIVIGDPAQLVDTTNAPRAIADAGSGKAKFAVPSIPGVGAQRTHSPSTPPPLGGRPNTPSTPPPMSERPRTPSVPPDFSSKPLPAPAKGSRLTSIGFPTIEKAPAFPPKTVVPGAAARPVTSQMAPVSADEPTAVGDVPPAPPARAPLPAPTPAARPAASVKVVEETTAVGLAPPTPVAAPNLKGPAAVAPAAVTAPSAPAAPPAPSSDEMTAVGEVPQAPEPPKKPTNPLPAAAAAKAQKMTSLGFPAVRTPYETQPVGTVRPSPPVVPGDTASAKSGGAPGPRGKSATHPPLTPRHPTPFSPVPIVRPPAKAAPLLEDAVVAAINEEEKTDMSEVPQAPAPAVDKDKVDPLAATQSLQSISTPTPTQRSGGMRASEIMAAIPSDDWTMSPDASAPTVLPPKETPLAIESTSKAKGPPTGNWSISLDPETGWSEPVKLEKPPAVEAAPAPTKKKKKAQPPRDPSAGNQIVAVASETGFTAVEWEEKPTGIGEAKIEIDSTLMEPLTPMPALDDEADASESQPMPTGSGSNRAIPPPLSAGMVPPLATSPYAAPPRATSPFAAPPPGSATSPFAAPPVGSVTSPFAAPPAPSAQGLFSDVRPSQADFSGAAALPDASAAKKKRLIIGIGAFVALAAGFALVLVLAGGKGKGTSADKGRGSAAAVVPTGSGSAMAAHVEGPGSEGSGAVVVEEPTGSGSGESGSAAVAIETPAIDAGTVETPVVADGPCAIAVTSVPTGAEVYQGDTKLGTTPASFELPCGIEAKLTLKKPRFISTARSFTPAAGKANKVAIKLAKPTFTVKVTSTPAGATITVGGRSMGVTPTQIRLPANEGASIVLSKPGYSSQSKVVTPKQNNISHHVTLKKGRR